MNIKKSKLYKEIKNNKTDSVIAIPFKCKTGITITESNIKFILESEIIQYEKKLNILKENGVEYPLNNKFKENLEKNLKSKIGEEMLDLKYIYVNSSNIDDAIKQVENSDFFSEWCVE